VVDDRRFDQNRFFREDFLVLVRNAMDKLSTDSEEKQLRDFYKTHGYLIRKNLIPNNDIEHFLDRIKGSLYENEEIEIPQMDTQKFGKVALTKYGYLKNPIADIHLLNFLSRDLAEAWDAAMRILTNTDLINTVNFLTQADNQSLVMSMYFDLNAGTPLHQDCYYLDTLPPRNITAGWIALEDINEKAGRFCLAPKSQDIFLDLSSEEIKNANAYENRIGKLIKDGNMDLMAPALRKGDVLFWNSGTIHGSLKTQDESFSRKSFTCHYVPTYCDYVQSQYVPTVRPISGFEYNGVVCRITNSIKKQRVNTELNPRSLDTFLR
jgi:phytanoyl-CoA hydroxylase